MRSLKKDTKKLYISKQLPSIPVLDENGFEIGEYAKVYDNPVAFNLNVKPISDKIERQLFGEDIDKILKITYTPFDSKNCIISEFRAVWLNVEPNGILTDKNPQNPMNNNYLVNKVINFGSQNVAYIKKTSGFPNEY